MRFTRGHCIVDSHYEHITYPEWQEVIKLPCGYCNKQDTEEGHDGCLGTLPYVKFACCGHGDIRQAYVLFEDHKIMREEHARDFFLKHGISMW